ncbi:MAG: transcription elongation factor GreA [Candidatus Paceibacterota bacterium]
MDKEKSYLTQDKFNELKIELESLKTVKRKEVAESLEAAKSLGDLSENAEYQEARELQAQIEDRIGYLENMLKTASIVGSHHSEKVEVGSTVVVHKGKEKTEYKYQIVGSEEANMAAGKLSNLSPLGLALMGKKVDETFTFKTPAGVVSYKVINIK